MGLDVYVGTLTRYYSRQWETVVQSAAREQGLALQVIRSDQPADAITDPREIEPAVVAWRDGVSAGLTRGRKPWLSGLFGLGRRHRTVDSALEMKEPLSWREGMEPPYFTDKPDWSSYSALLTFAAHDEHPGVPMPAVAPDDWTTDPAIARSMAPGFTSRYSHLLGGCELWLPADFEFTFETEDLGGAKVCVGSAAALKRQLADLNDRRWRADTNTLARWRYDAPDRQAPIEVSAQFGFAVVSILADHANEHRLPMKLDY